MSAVRPDPDALLARVQREEARAKRGKLTVFFGATAGVGKTYAMLEAARAQYRKGVDIVVGYVEPHGRAETEALLQGLEALPYLWIDYRGKRVREFDLDAALARKPAVLLVDELAHSNPVGGRPEPRHAKRWQDVEELLAAGISLYTTVNVQHVESLNDVVEQITQVHVRETVPDVVLERADDVELVDLAPCAASRAQARESRLANVQARRFHDGPGCEPFQGEADRVGIDAGKPADQQLDARHSARGSGPAASWSLTPIAAQSKPSLMARTRSKCVCFAEGFNAAGCAHKVLEVQIRYVPLDPADVHAGHDLRRLRHRRRDLFRRELSRSVEGAG